MAFPRFVDLRMVERELGSNPEFRPLKRLLRRSIEAQSCTSDLAQAGDCILALDSLLASPRRKGRPDRNTTETALLITSVVLYARGTDDDGRRGARGSVNILAALTTEQKRDHDAIVRVRSRAFAHVHANEPLDDQVVWHRDLAFAVEQADGWKPGSASQRVQISKPLLERLRRQIPAAYEELRARYLRNTADLIDYLNAVPALSAVFDRYIIDPVSAFGSDSAVREVLAGIPSGKATFYA